MLSSKTDMRDPDPIQLLIADAIERHLVGTDYAIASRSLHRDTADGTTLIRLGSKEDTLTAHVSDVSTSCELGYDDFVVELAGCDDTEDYTDRVLQALTGLIERVERAPSPARRSYAALRPVSLVIGIALLLVGFFSDYAFHRLIAQGAISLDDTLNGGLLVEHRQLRDALRGPFDASGLVATIRRNGLLLGMAAALLGSCLAERRFVRRQGRRMRGWWIVPVVTFLPGCYGLLRVFLLVLFSVRHPSAVEMESLSEPWLIFCGVGFLWLAAVIEPTDASAGAKESLRSE